MQRKTTQFAANRVKVTQLQASHYICQVYATKYVSYQWMIGFTMISLASPERCIVNLTSDLPLTAASRSSLHLIFFPSIFVITSDGLMPALKHKKLKSALQLRFIQTENFAKVKPRIVLFSSSFGICQGIKSLQILIILSTDPKGFPNSQSQGCI